MRVSRGYGQYRVLVQPGTSCSQAAADGRSHEAKGLPHRQSSSSGPAPWRRGAATRCPLVLIQSYHFLMCSKEHVVVSCGRSAGLLLFFLLHFMSHCSTIQKITAYPCCYISSTIKKWVITFQSHVIIYSLLFI
jgi:hypothetical protein